MVIDISKLEIAKEEGVGGRATLEFVVNNSKKTIESKGFSRLQAVHQLLFSLAYDLGVECDFPTMHLVSEPPFNSSGKVLYRRETGEEVEYDGTAGGPDQLTAHFYSNVEALKKMIKGENLVLLY